MVSTALEIFVADVMGAGEISRRNVRELQFCILPNGFSCRDEVDVLVALDRAIAAKDPAWSAFLIRAAVDYVVWASRPTGYIDAEAASWLVASLSCGTGPTETGVAIGFEIVREAERSDETLVSFVMRWSGGLHHEVLVDSLSDGLV